MPEFSYVIFITLLALGFCFHFKLRKFCAFLFGIAWLLFHGASYNETLNINQLDATSLYSAPILVSGTIDSLISYKRDHKKETKKNISTLISKGDSNTIQPDPNDIIRFNFNIFEVNNKKLATPFKVRLSWKKPERIIKQNQQWQLLIKIKPAHGLANTGGFSYQTWLRSKHLVASGYVKKQQVMLLNRTTSLRQRWFERAKKTLKDKAFSQLYLALMFGERGGLTQQDWQVLQATGTQHLIAISGLHIGLIAGVSYFLSLWFFRSLPLSRMNKRLVKVLMPINLKLVNLNIHWIAVIFSLFIAVFYSYLAGFSSPTLRALIMLILYWLMKFSGAHLSKTRLLALTVFCILIIQPMSILGAGFWLSFYAVCIIFFTHWFFKSYLERYKGLKKSIYALFIIQFSLTVFILPVAALLQNQLPLLSIVANVIAVPVISLCVLPITFISFLVNLVVESTFLIDLTLTLFSLFWQWLVFIAQFKDLVINISDSKILLTIFVIFLLVVIWLMVSKKKAIMFIMSLAFILATKVMLFNKVNEKWQVNVFDVGQGLSVLIEKEGKAILYDTGASYPSGFIMAETVIHPYLKSQGITGIDKMIISHSDNDHAGGSLWLRNNIAIEDVMANDKNLNPTTSCVKGQGFNWQNLHFEVLWPLTINDGESNDDSCVIQISDGTHKVLLTGDISHKVERKLISHYQLASNVLIVPHHGSNTSSSTEFIQAVSPLYAIYSAGFMNRWKMPTAQVVNRYKSAGVSTLNTAQSGMISLRFNQELIRVYEYKKHVYPFWFAN